MHPTRQDRPQKLAQWKERIARENISVPSDRGALWSGIGADAAKRLAVARHLITLEMTPLGASLDNGPFSQQLVSDFGSDWIAEKRLIFREASIKFANALSGLVTVFLPETMVRPREGAPGSFAYNVKILWDEFKDTDFGDPRILTHRITAMRICRVRGGMVSSETFMSSSDQIH